MNLLTIGFAVTGLLAAFSFIGSNLRGTFLESDGDGLQPLGWGAVFYFLSFAVAPLDVAAGYLLSGLGMLFVVYGLFVLIPDPITDFLLHPVAGIVYALVAAVIFLSTPHAMALTAGYVLRLTLPTSAAAILATFAALSLTTSSFKDKLEQQVGGVVLLLAGIVFGILAPFAGTVILAVTAAGLGGLLFALGLLVAIDDDTVERFLTPAGLIAYLPLLGLAVYIARMLF